MRQAQNIKDEVLLEAVEAEEASVNVLEEMFEGCVRSVHQLHLCLRTLPHASIQQGSEVLRPRGQHHLVGGDGLVVGLQDQGDITVLLAQVELAQVVRQVGHVLHLTHHRHRRERLLAGHRYLLSSKSEENRNFAN